MSPEIKKTSVTTRGGDSGRTDTLSGREFNDSPKIELNGIFDEFQAILGVVIAKLGNEKSDLVLNEEKTIQILMNGVYFQSDPEEILIGIKNFVDDIEKTEVDDLFKLADEGIKTAEVLSFGKRYKEYFLGVKEIFDDKNKRSNRIDLKAEDIKMRMEDSFGDFFNSTKMAMNLMDSNDELNPELIDINNDFLNILKKAKGENVVLNLEDRVWELEDLGKDLEKDNPQKNIFLYFGDNLIEACLNLSRTRARRAERRVVALERQKGKQLLPNGVLIYMNRVSDILYLMSVIKK